MNHNDHAQDSPLYQYDVFLGDVFTFTREDLAANAQGQITEHQRQRLAGSAGLFFKQRKPALDLRSVEGSARLTVHEETERLGDGAGSAAVVYYALYVDDVHFRIDKMQYHALKNERRYRVYFVEMTHRLKILSIALAAGVSDAPVKTDTVMRMTDTDRLRRAFRFSDSDIEANRAGTVSDAQKNRRSATGRQNQSVLVVIAIFMPIIGIGAVVTLFGAAPTGSSVQTVLCGGPGLFMGLFFGFWLLLLVADLVRRFVLPPLKVRADLSAGVVKAVEGRAALDTVRTDGGYNVGYRLKIGGATFRLTLEQYKAFDHRELYHVYYLPRSRTIVSAEIAAPPVKEQQ
ncbi:MAG: hypothetical protein SF162_07845 [bacterium]|nr:hypothetical protein [bacterium]